MKIINTSILVRRPFDREHFVDLELRRLQEELDVGNIFRANEETLQYKEELLKVLDRAATDAQKQGMETQPATETAPARGPTDFQIFTRLPAELRVRIWEIVMEPHLLFSRIHCVQERSSRFISNQPLSPLLHVCRESRNFYIESTQTTFAFGSYINFSRDIIYIPDSNTPQGFLQRFLPSYDARLIQKLAVVKEAFIDLPLEGSPHTYHLKLREWLPNWREWIIVFGDDRSSDDYWPDTEMVFRTLSAREQRKRAERSYARAMAKMYNSVWVEPLHFRYVVHDFTESFRRAWECGMGLGGYV
jgi:hypothetical protein